VIARGLGRSYGDAAQNAGGWVLDTTRLSSIRALDTSRGIVTVEAGVSIGALIRAVLPHGWFPAVTPGTRNVTVGGAIACDVHGKNHHRDGGFCRHVTSLELLTPAGETISLSPRNGGGAFWATAGGLGLTGIVVAATLQLRRVETAWITEEVERAADLDDVMGRMTTGDVDYRYSVAWIDCLTRGRAMGRSVLFRGDHATTGELSPAGGRNPLEAPSREVLTVPDRVSPGLVNRLSVRAFNELYFRRAPTEQRGRLRPLASFFYPLDAVGGWNRLYGGAGLVQYQLAVPFGAEDVVRGALERLAREGCPAFLAVLKQLGPGGGPLSFPAPGWTLAVDVPARFPGLPKLLDDLDTRVVEAGGRVYLGKDSRLRAELLEPMYPGFGRWREVRARLDPGERLRSDLARRLGLLREGRAAP